MALATSWRAAPRPDGYQLAVFPSALAFTSVAEALAGSSIRVGAQNVYWVDQGGYTGEVSAAMFAAAGAQYALIGHSERRHQFHETNHEVRQKLEAALASGLTPLLCVGETAAERSAGRTWEVIETQLRAAYHNLVWPAKTDLLIAYEPVWAISRGTERWGADCPPGEAEVIHTRISDWLQGIMSGVAPQVLFGGSVRAANLGRYLAEPHLAGVLVGAASTQPDRWSALLANITPRAL